MSERPNMSWRTPRDAALPERIGRYVVVDRIGAGMMGVVYRAYDPHLDRRVAIKVLHAGKRSKEAQQRLVREARSMARLSHGHVVQIYDVGVLERQGQTEVFLALELVEGRDLEAWLEALDAERPNPEARWRRVVQVFLQAARGLAAAHAAGVVHRDFKPSNVLVGPDDVAKVGDFGLARVPTEDDPAEAPTPPSPARGPEAARRSAELPLTASGDLLGTPAFMSPEQHEGAPADARSDQFAFCVSLWEALFGEPPFPGDSLATRAVAVIEGQLRSPPEGTVVPAEVVEVVRRGLSRDPEARFETMRALREALEDAATPRRRGARIAAVLATAAVIGSIAWIASRPGPCEGAEEELRRVWSVDVREEVLSSLEQAGLPYSGRVARAVGARLDEYAGAWARAHEAACLATRVRHVQSEELLDRRMACLESRRLELAAFVRELSRADAALLDGAVRAAEELSPLAPCANRAALTAAVPPPDDPEEAEDVARLRRALAQARGQARAGRYRAALDTIHTATTALGAPEHVPARAELALAAGGLFAALSDHPRAEADLRRAFLLAQQARHAPVAARAAGALVTLVGVERSRPDEGLLWADIARATWLQTGAHSRARADLEGDRARVLSAKGDREAAMKAARQALEQLEAEGVGGLALGRAALHLGSTLVDTRDYRRALAPLERALALYEATLGPEHPEVVKPLTWLGRAQHGAARFDAARETLERAVALATRSLGADHPLRARALMRRAALQTRLNEHEGAIRDYREALRILVAVYGETHTLVARAWLNLGVTFHRMGQLDQATEHYRRALELREALLGPNHPDLALILQNLSSMAIEAGRPGAAIADLERALRIRTETLSAPTAIADIEFWLGRALYESGRDRRRGLTLVRRAYQTMVAEQNEAAKHPRAWLRARGRPLAEAGGR